MNVRREPRDQIENETLSSHITFSAMQGSILSGVARFPHFLQSYLRNARKMRASKLFQKSSHTVLLEHPLAFYCLLRGNSRIISSNGVSSFQ